MCFNSSGDNTSRSSSCDSTVISDFLKLFLLPALECILTSELPSPWEPSEALGLVALAGDVIVFTGGGLDSLPTSAGGDACLLE